jgi:hypothetical protein
MAKLTLYASNPRLTASRADRTLTGTLLPYGEVGITNLGKLRASTGKLSFGPGLLPLNLDHDTNEVVGHVARASDTPARLQASFAVAPGPKGDAALADAELASQLTRRGMDTGQLRCHLSIEVDNCVVRGGQLLGGVITGAALVAEPAFAGAKLAAAELDDVPDLGDDDTEDTEDTEGDGQPTGEVVAASVIDETYTYVAPDGSAVTTEYHTESTTTETEPDPNGAPTMTAARVQTPNLTPPGTANDANRLFASLASGFSKGLTGNRLEAALADVVPGDILGVEQPQYVGQLWAGVPYERRFIPLFDHADLTSFTIKGWQWADGKRPEVALYEGNKADIPSNDVETIEASGVLQRIAGGHDIDRKFKDFSNAEFWAAYFAAMAESYARVSDRYIRDQAKAIPTAANGGRVHLTNAAMPSGVPKALALVTKGALKLLNGDLEVMPTFALVTASYFEELMYTPQEQVLAYLSTSLGLGGGEVSGFKLVPVPDGSLTVGGWVGQVLVGHRSALTVHELPGSPIRVEAEAISKGGIDEALFGYVGHMLENAKGLVSFDAPSA